MSEQVIIKEINLANINDVSLLTTSDCRINLGGVYSLNKDISVLERLFRELKLNLADIEYIDLRFKEPVVKYKAA